MKLKGIIDCDFINYKEPVLTLEFPTCDFKCDKLNGCQVCQNSSLAREPDIEISLEEIWNLYEANPLTRGFCCQGLEPLDSTEDLVSFITLIRKKYKCDDVIVIYTGYDKEEMLAHNANTFLTFCKNMGNIIVKWGRYIMNQQPHYDEILGVKLASDNQYAEWIQ